MHISWYFSSSNLYILWLLIFPVKESYNVYFSFNFLSLFEIVYILAFFKIRLQFKDGDNDFISFFFGFFNFEKFFTNFLWFSLFILSLLYSIKLKVKESKSVIDLITKLLLIASKNTTLQVIVFLLSSDIYLNLFDRASLEQK